MNPVIKQIGAPVVLTGLAAGVAATVNGADTLQLYNPTAGAIYFQAQQVSAVPVAGVGMPVGQGQTLLLRISGTAGFWASDTTGLVVVPVEVVQY